MTILKIEARELRRQAISPGRYVLLILTRGSRPEAVLISYEDYLRFQQMQENEVLANFHTVWTRLAEVNAAVSEDELFADIKTARQSSSGLADAGGD